MFVTVLSAHQYLSGGRTSGNRLILPTGASTSRIVVSSAGRITDLIVLSDSPKILIPKAERTIFG